MPVIISPNMILGGSPGALPPFPLTHAMIGYKTICTAANVLASSQAAGCPASDAVNIFTNEYWRPDVLPATWTVDAGTGVNTDYIGIAAHTLGTSGASIEIFYSTDGVAWTSLFAFAPVDNAPIMLIYEPILARYWRIEVTGVSIPRLGVIYVGQMLQMQRPIYGGHAPITLSRDTTIFNQMSESGQFMARSITRQGNSTTYAWKNLTALWYRQYFDPFVKAVRRVPFFIAWRPIDFPTEVGFVWTKTDPKPSNMGTRDLMEVSIDVSGVTDE